MANDKDFKVKNGIQPTAYHEAVGTVVSAVENAGPVGVFSTDTYSGGTAQQINNDIDFSTDGGLVCLSCVNLF
jgi:3-phosphoglycerate kinase